MYYFLRSQVLLTHSNCQASICIVLSNKVLTIQSLAHASGRETEHTKLRRGFLEGGDAVVDLLFVDLGAVLIDNVLSSARKNAT